MNAVLEKRSGSTRRRLKTDRGAGHRCVYCGGPSYQAATCAKHHDLRELDAEWWEHRSARAWWRRNYTQEEINEFASHLEAAA